MKAFEMPWQLKYNAMASEARKRRREIPGNKSSRAIKYFSTKNTYIAQGIDVCAVLFTLFNLAICHRSLIFSVVEQYWLNVALEKLETFAEWDVKLHDRGE